MIALTLDLSRIDKKRTFVGKTGRKYLSFVLVDGVDKYGNDGMIVHSVSREERLAGVKGEICGNWRHVGNSKPNTPPKLPSLKGEVEDLFL